jgi:MacB-like protein
MGSRVDAEGSGVCNREVLAHSAASDYFSTLKMPLTRGRAWSQADDARARAVAVINETMVRQLWNPIGRHVRDMSFAARRPQWLLNAAGQDGWFEIIGVMRDAPNQGLPEPIAPAIYYPYTAALGDGAVLLVQQSADHPVRRSRGLLRMAAGSVRERCAVGVRRRCTPAGLVRVV